MRCVAQMILCRTIEQLTAVFRHVARTLFSRVLDEQCVASLAELRQPVEVILKRFENMVYNHKLNVKL